MVSIRNQRSNVVLIIIAYNSGDHALNLSYPHKTIYKSAEFFNHSVGSVVSIHNASFKRVLVLGGEMHLSHDTR